MPNMTLKRAVTLAAETLYLKRQEYAFQTHLYNHGVFNAKTTHAFEQTTQLTEAINLLKSLVSPIVDQVARVDTKP